MSSMNALEKLPLIEWAAKRCISPDVMSMSEMMYDPKRQCIMYPRKNPDGKTLGWKVRYLNGDRQFNLPGGIPLRDTVPFTASNGNGEVVVLCEGESDSLAFASNSQRFSGATVLGIPGSTGFSSSWVEIIQAYDEIFVVPDADVAGEKLVQKVCGLVPRTRVVRLNEGEDLTDALLARGIEDLERRFDCAQPVRIRTQLRHDSHDYVGSCNYDPSNLLHLVQQHTKMFRRGNELMGLCPLHEERTPSFMVNEEKGLFFCHGCGKGGDVIAYLQAKNGFSFKEAVRFIEDTRR